jgi:hypothetical protein
MRAKIELRSRDRHRDAEAQNGSGEKFGVGGATMTFEGVTYTVASGKGEQRKAILDGITGYAHANARLSQMYFLYPLIRRWCRLHY